MKMASTTHALYDDVEMRKSSSQYIWPSYSDFLMLIKYVSFFENPSGTNLHPDLEGHSLWKPHWLTHRHCCSYTKIIMFSGDIGSILHKCTFQFWIKKFRKWKIIIRNSTCPLSSSALMWERKWSICYYLASRTMISRCSRHLPQMFNSLYSYHDELSSPQFFIGWWTRKVQSKSIAVLKAGWGRSWLLDRDGREKWSYNVVSSQFQKLRPESHV